MTEKVCTLSKKMGLLFQCQRSKMCSQSMKEGGINGNLHEDAKGALLCEKLGKLV